MPSEGSSLFLGSTRLQLKAGYQMWYAQSKFWSRHDAVPLLERQPRVPSAPENVEEALGAEQKRLQLQSRIFPSRLHGESGTP